MYKLKSISLKARAKSFSYAATGFVRLVKQEANMRIHLITSIIVVSVGLVKTLTTIQWLAIVFAIGLVWMAEAFNTALEMVCDLISDKFHPNIKVIKDISAAAVLIASATSVTIAFLILF